MDANQEHIDLDKLASMSDDEISQLDLSDLNDVSEPEDTQTDELPAEDLTVTDDEHPADQISEEEVSEPNRSVSEDAGSGTDDETDKGQPDTNVEHSRKDTPKVVADDVQSKADAYDLIMQPFKANGHMMTLESPEEVVALMQKGANYTKKMNELTPMRKIHKVLVEHGLMDQDKIAFAVDLLNKKPEAIAKLLADSELDAYNLPEASTYVPTETNVTDESLLLDEVMSEVRATDTGSRTLNTLVNEWDTFSQTHFANNPQEILVLNNQMADGTFDKVWTEVNRMRTLGRVDPKMSDLHAYLAVMERMMGEQSATPSKQPIAKKVVTPAAKSNNAARKAAATPSVATKVAIDDIASLAALSDEEFLKLSK